MTNNSDKLRSLILAALMVFSVFAGSIALTGSAAASVNVDGEPLDSGETFYSGQDVGVDGLNASEEYRVRTLNDDDEPGTLVRKLSADSDNSIEFTLDEQLASGDFVLVNSDGDPVTVQDGTAVAYDNTRTDGYAADEAFEVVSQDLSAEFEDSSVGNDGGATDVEYEITSNVRTNYYVNVSADGLDDSDLVGIFGSSNVTDTISSDDGVIRVAGDTTYDLDFQDVNSDTYTFEANVNDTDASDSADIEVTDTGSASADFGDNVFVDQRGDIVNVTIEMSNTDEATVQIGQESNNGYALVAQVTDDDEDGVAYVEFNSFIAGNANETATVATAGDDDTDVTFVSATDLDNEPSGTDVLDATSYDMFVTEGTETSVTSNNADARATLQLNDASVDDLQVWTAPEDTYGDLSGEDAENIGNYIGTNLTQTDSVAAGDTVVVQVQASGLEGALENRDTTNTSTELYGGASLAADSDILVGLNFEGPPVPNQEEQDVAVGSLGDGNYSVIYDDANDQHFVVVDSTAMVDTFENGSYTFDDGDQFTANFTVYDNSDIVDEDTSVTGDFDVENADAELDTNEDEEIVLSAASEQEVTGDTNLAPGTEIELELDSDTSGDPFVKRPEATVQEDGTFTALADFSENSAGSEFTASIVTVENTDEYDGRLVEGEPEPSTDTPEEDTATDTPEEMTDTAEEMTDTAEEMTDTAEEMTETEADSTATETGTSGGSGPGFTAAIALIALVAAALLAVRRNN